MSDSLPPRGQYSPWNSPCQNTGVGSCSLLQGIFPTQGSNPGLPHCRWILYQLSHQGSPRILEWAAAPFSRGYSWPRNWTRSPALQADSIPAELPNQPKSHRKKEQHPSYANVDSRHVPKTPFFPVKLSSLLGLLFFRNFAVASVKIWDCSLMSTTMFTWKKGHDVGKEGTNIYTNQLILRPHDFTQACQRPTPPSYISNPDIFPVFKTACFPPCWTLTFGCIIVLGWIAPRLVCGSSQGRKELDMTEQLNSTELRCSKILAWILHLERWQGGNCMKLEVGKVEQGGTRVNDVCISEPVIMVSTWKSTFLGTALSDRIHTSQARPTEACGMCGV